MKKGFTLLEILAVIVALSIIALVLTPLVTKAIDEAKKGAFTSSVYNLIESGELFHSKKFTDEYISTTVIHSVNGEELDGLDFKYKGKLLENVYLEIDETGKSKLLVWDNGFCAKKDFQDAQLVVTNSDEADCYFNNLNAPILQGGSDEWAVSRTISVLTPPSMEDLVIDHYQYYISTSNNASSLIGGEWLDLDVGIDSVTINTNGEYYVFMRVVDTDGKNGLTSEGERVRIDTTDYTITYPTGLTGGTITGGKSTAKIGETVTLTITTETGYELNALLKDSVNLIGATSFIMTRGNAVITGSFEKIEYQLTWTQVTGGTLTVKVNNVVKTSPATVTTGDTVVVTPSPTTGYQLSTLTYNGADIKATKTFSVGTTSGAISATWSKLTYLITYNPNGGSGGPGTQTKTYGTVLNLASVFPTRSGYLFIGWGTNSSATIATYQPGGSYTANAEITLHAVWKQYFYHNILANNTNRYTRSSFNSTLSTSNNGNGIYYAAGQGGKTTYYFAGTVTNNYVKFGKTNYTQWRGYNNSSGTGYYIDYNTAAECSYGVSLDGDEDAFSQKCTAVIVPGKDLWWRIVRINEDNSVRLIYAGLSATDTAGYIKIRESYLFFFAYNAVGYKFQYGRSLEDGRLNVVDSGIKGKIDSWYNTNFNQTTYKDANGYTFDKSISRTATYCNDRNIGTGSYGSGCYAACTRLTTNRIPTFTCPHASDRFNATNSSALLTYPVALLTADEAAYAGGVYGLQNQNYYLNQNATIGIGWWTMTPYYSNHTESINNMLAIHRNGSLYFNDARGYTWEGFIGIRPVISIKACATSLSGDGTSGRPYIFKVNSTCSSANN